MIYVGKSAILRLTVRDPVTLATTDVSTLIAKVKKPRGGIVTTYSFPGNGWSNLSTGIYILTIACDQVGDWTYSIEANGIPVEGTWAVARQIV